MDAYPQPYVANDLPFILLCGLEADDPHLAPNPEEAGYPLLKENGLVIESDFPHLEGPVAEELRGAFLDHDASRNSRDDLASAQNPEVQYRIKSVGRVRGRALLSCSTSSTYLVNQSANALHRTIGSLRARPILLLLHQRVRQIPEAMTLPVLLKSFFIRLYPP